MKCPKCKKTDLSNKKIDYAAEVRKVRVKVNCVGLLCSECGYKTFAPAQMVIFRRALNDAYRSKMALLTSEEIKRARERLGMNQEEFAAYLGVGVASIKRWELGKIQDASSDQLIRLKSDPERAANNSAEVRRRISAVHPHL